MTLIIPYQSITIISYVRVVLPASVCFSSKHQSQICAPACPLSYYSACVQLTTFQIICSILLSVSDPSLLFPPHFFFFRDDSTPQALPSETSLLLSNVKSISQFVNASLVLWLPFRLLTHTITHTQSHTQ